MDYSFFEKQNYLQLKELVEELEIKEEYKTKKELILLINEKNNIIENIKEKKDIEEKIIKKDIDKYNIND